LYQLVKLTLANFFGNQKYYFKLFNGELSLISVLNNKYQLIIKKNKVDYGLFYFKKKKLKQTEKIEIIKILISQELIY
jgi:hypothetical protein